MLVYQRVHWHMDLHGRFAIGRPRRCAAARPRATDVSGRYGATPAPSHGFWLCPASKKAAFVTVMATFLQKLAPETEDGKSTMNEQKRTRRWPEQHWVGSKVYMVWENMGNLSENMGIFWDLRGFNHIPGFVSSVFWLNVLNEKSAMTGEWITGCFALLFWSPLSKSKYVLYI